MPTPRLTFLYPHLFRTARLGEATSSATVGRLSARSARRTPSLPSCPNANTFSTSTSVRQSTFATRHEKAVEPLPLHSVPKAAPAASRVEAAAENKPAKGTGDDGLETNRKDGASEIPQAQAKAEPVVDESGPPPPSASDAQAATSASDSTIEAAGPMDTILQMGPPPSSFSSDGSAPNPDNSDPTSPTTKPAPHLTPPAYVHHFDSYSLVKQLSSGGYTQAQAITAMKAIRGLLATNLSAAQAGLVGKSDVENESYLFRAACSELSTEVRNNRRVADEGLRQQRTLQQHEVDILTQRLSGELLTLNDNVRGMFNDRRMAVREEQKAAESAIQQINYKISVMLNSDSKSDIEGLRWVLIRRSALGIIFMVVLTLGSLRYASYRSHERQKEEAEKAAKEAEKKREVERHDGKRDHLAGPDAAEILAAN